MSKTHIDIDEDLLAQVAAITGTTTKRDTVKAALRHEHRRAAAERLITRAESGYSAPVFEEHPQATVEDAEAPDPDDRAQGVA